jgi:peptidoglycan/xylan/chitin deacetylase (PgdA/CDA1 family)
MKGSIFMKLNNTLICIFAMVMIGMVFTLGCQDQLTAPKVAKETKQDLQMTGLEKAAGGSIYLCFDDGPCSNTPTLISKLKSAGVTATFFIWGSRVNSYSANFNAIKSAGCGIQNHSYTHSHMTSWSYSQVYNDLNQCNSAITSRGVAKPTKFRPPYLETNATIQSAASALGLTIVMPTVDTKDWNGASTSAIVSACNHLQAGGNPLMHDGYSTTNNAIAQIVTNLKNKGFSFAKY